MQLVCEMPECLKRVALTLSVLSILSSVNCSAAEVAVAEPAGYRLDEYKAPVPATLAGAEVATTQEVAALWEQKAAIFFDVMPRLPKPDNLPKGTIWRDAPRKDIPGSIWLANVGYGEITKETEAYFQAGLAANTAGDKTRKILIYCMTDCWMSWNAAKRAVSWGYTSVIWYPDGADGWERAKHTLTAAIPYAAR